MTTRVGPVAAVAVVVAAICFDNLFHANVVVVVAAEAALCTCSSVCWLSSRFRSRHSAELLSRCCYCCCCC